MVRNGDFSGRPEHHAPGSDRTESAGPPDAEHVPGGDRPIDLAEAATWWELRDDLVLHSQRTEEPPRSLEDYALVPPGTGHGKTEIARRADQMIFSAIVDGLERHPLAGEAGAGPVIGGYPALPSGDRIAFWRKRRGLHQIALARRLNVSWAWLAAVEAGADRLGSIDEVHAVADALRIDTPMLMGADPHGSPSITGLADDEVIEDVQAALERSNDPMRAYHAPAATRFVDPRALAIQLRAGWRMYGQATYSPLLRTLTRLLDDAAAADGRQHTADRDNGEPARLLSQAYQLTSAVLRRIGLHPAARLAADRAFEAAARSGDHLLQGSAARHAAAALLAMGRAPQALHLSRHAASRIGQITPRTTAVNTVYATLLEQGVLAAASTGDAAGTDELLDTIAGTAAGDHVSVPMCEAAAAVELGDGERAIAAHQRLSTGDPDRLTPQQQATHHLMLARAYTQIGEITHAADALFVSAEHAPAEVRCPLGQTIVTDILRTANRRQDAIASRIKLLVIS